MKRSLLLLPLAVALSNLATAEIRKCGSVYTDRPCNQVPSEEDVSAAPQPRSPAAKEEALIRSKKRSLLHDLRMKRLDARKDLGVDLDISEAEDVCQDEASTLEACRRLVNELDDKLDSRIVAHTQAKGGKKEKPAIEREEAKKGDRQESNAVVVVQDNSIVRRPPPIIIIDSGPVEPVGRAPRSRHPDRPTSKEPPKKGPPYKVQQRERSVINSGIHQPK